MHKVNECINEIYKNHILANLNLTTQENEYYFQEVIKKNKHSFRLLTAFLFILELYSILSILIFSDSKLSTLNNRIYFIMHLILFLIGIIFWILEYYLKNNIEKLNIMYMIIAFLGILWHVAINYCDLVRDPSSNTAIYIIALFTCAMFFYFKPIFEIFLNITSLSIFLIITHNILDASTIINLVIIVLTTTTIAIRRYIYLIQSIRKNNALNDMNAEIQQKHLELQISLRKQKVIMEYTNDIIIEWDSKSDILNFSNNMQNNFSFPTTISNARQWIRTTSDIHPDDVINILSEFRRIASIQGSGIIKVRIREKTGKYIWYQARLYIQREKDKIGTLIIGILTNINEQQQQLEKLVDQSSKDLLTGLYNKVTTEQKITKLLTNNSIGTIYMIDLDNFKLLNDTLGHATGDKALKDVANILKEFFLKFDIIGRIGGDEFIVFCPNFVNEESIINRANLLIQSLRQTYGNKQNSVRLSASVGIYLGTKEDNEFKNLYQKVDDALYKAKSLGKNQFYFR